MKRFILMTGLISTLAAIFPGVAQSQSNDADLASSINAAIGGDTQVAVILPTGEKTQDADDRIGAYAKAVAQQFYKNRCLILNDSEALQKDLSQYAIITYGTPAGNLWVRRNLPGWPLVITDEKIVTDQEFHGSHQRLISLWFNPANPAKPWIIYTAQDAQDVAGINGVFHG